MLLVEADTGKVLHAENATMPWYPASITKLMTAYVTLQAVKSKRITLDTLFTVSARAAAQAPSKIGFKPGTQVTVDNALKMLMVKSANDIAVVLAEGVGGSVEKLLRRDERAPPDLGMTQSNWVNPNGLPADEQISSARDLAILARALLRDFPEYDMYWHIPAIQFGKKYMRNYNTLIGRYDGADGMKTGFICASGFNLVASRLAQRQAPDRGGARLAVVAVSRAPRPRACWSAASTAAPLSWLTPSLGTVDSLQPINAAPPDLRDEMCGKHRKRPAAEDADDDDATRRADRELHAVEPAAQRRQGFGAAQGPARRRQGRSSCSSARRRTLPKRSSPTRAPRSRSSPRARRPTPRPPTRPPAADASDRRPPAAADRHRAAGRRLHADDRPAGRAVRKLPAATDVSNPRAELCRRRPRPSPRR